MPQHNRPDGPTLAATKQALRRDARAARAALPAAVRADAGTRIIQRLAEVARSVEARRIGAYAAAGHEVDVDPLVTAWLGEGRQVALPRAASPSELAFHLVQRLPTTRGAFGIREPQPDDPPATRLDLVVVPGLAFDTAGGRIGSGLGYYDRWLASQYPRPLAVGVCFAVQLVGDVPRGAFDIDLDAVVTEGAVYM